MRFQVKANGSNDVCGDCRNYYPARNRMGFLHGVNMAGPWIKVEYATPDKIEVARIAKKLGIHRLHAFGLCYEFWRWCDAHLQNGHICDFCLDDVDEKVHHVGFGTALSEVGWLLIEDDRIIVANFDRHLGQSAKTRADAAKRQATKRSKDAPKKVSR